MKSVLPINSLREGRRGDKKKQKKKAYEYQKEKFSICTGNTFSYSLSEYSFWTLHTTEILPIFELFLELLCTQPDNTVNLQSLFVMHWTSSSSAECYAETKVKLLLCLVLGV